MEVSFQWATSSPGRSLRVDASDWRHLPKSPKPKTGDRSAVSGRLGLVNVVDLFGNHFHADRYAVEDMNDGKDGVRVTAINDGFHPASPVRSARQVDFWPLSPDPDLNGAINTVYRHTFFTDDPALLRLRVRGMEIKRWSDFVPPDESLVRYGADLSDSHFRDHQKMQSRSGWREWTHGVDRSELNDVGHVAQQQPQGRYIFPDGTRTYYLTSQARDNPIHAANNELAFEVSPGSAVNVDSGNINQNGSTIFTGVTLPGEPDSAAWPTGVYRAQWDVVVSNTDVIFGVQNLGTALGHFARVSDLLGTPVEAESKQQVEPSFALTGLHLSTSGSVSWSPGSASDVFEVAYCAQRITGHGNASMTMQLGEPDDFVDGPWPSASSGRRIFVC